MAEDEDVPVLKQLWRVEFETGPGGVFLTTSSRDLHAVIGVAKAFSDAEIDSITYVGECFLG